MSNKHVINSSIVIGDSTILYELDTENYGTAKYNPGWVLPGGEITLDKLLVITVATNIDNLIQKAAV